MEVWLCKMTEFWGYSIDSFVMVSDSFCTCIAKHIFNKVETISGLLTIKAY